MKDIYINKIKQNEKEKKNLQVEMQLSFSLNNFGVRVSLQSWRQCLRCCCVVVSSKGTHKVEQN
jgi:NADH:ubiquinone oxidoreductase subunit B-like Fe-S oxidoreductase